MKQVPLKNLCSFTHPQERRLFNQSESAAIVHDSWTNGNISNFQNCTFTIDSNLYSNRGQYRRGLFASIKTLNLRKDAKGKCIDFVQFSFSNRSSTDKFCDRIMAADEQRKHFTDVGGTIKVFIHVNKTAPFHALQRSIEVNLVFTAYERRFYYANHIFFLQF